MVRDRQRPGADARLTFRLPEPVPQNSLLAARRGPRSPAQGRGGDFSGPVDRAGFSEGRHIGDPKVVGEIVAALGENANDALAQAQSDDTKQKLRTATDDAQRLGVFGAPSFIAAGELYWGNDRLEQALRAARSKD